ncbi:hypothetical protein PL321_05400 [Caloramator sp. mosi_1]|nr:hypothetical protein [Caloramator sp. mosi_1]WDC84985.1 hypothetical protein PL321_05400 [Caloramator sp. mosi_1]
MSDSLSTNFIVTVSFSTVTFSIICRLFVSDFKYTLKLLAIALLTSLLNLRTIVLSDGATALKTFKVAFDTMSFADVSTDVTFTFPPNTTYLAFSIPFAVANSVLTVSEITSSTKTIAALFLAASAAPTSASTKFASAPFAT